MSPEAKDRLVVRATFNLRISEGAKARTYFDTALVQNFFIAAGSETTLLCSKKSFEFVVTVYPEIGLQDLVIRRGGKKIVVIEHGTIALLPDGGSTLFTLFCYAILGFHVALNPDDLAQAQQNGVQLGCETELELNRSQQKFLGAVLHSLANNTASRRPTRGGVFYFYFTFRLR